MVALIYLVAGSEELSLDDRRYSKVESGVGVDGRAGEVQGRWKDGLCGWAKKVGHFSKSSGRAWCHFVVKGSGSAMANCFFDQGGFEGPRVLDCDVSANDRIVVCANHL